MREALKLIRLIATRGAKVTDLMRLLGVSRATVFRLMAACERDLGVHIECDKGRFSLRSWGLLNQRKVLS
jgi:DNA-binding IclR family transcriptional regulator